MARSCTEHRWENPMPKFYNVSIHNVDNPADTISHGVKVKAFSPENAALRAAGRRGIDNADTTITVGDVIVARVSVRTKPCRRGRRPARTAL